MKTKIFKSVLAVAIASPALLTSCIEETVPTQLVTDSQLAESPKASEALLWEMTAIYNKFNTLGADQHYDWGYGSIMHIRDVMTEDYAVASSSYDHYSAWEQDLNIGESYMTTQFVWTYFWKQVQTANNVLRAMPAVEAATDAQRGSIAIASAQRASMYLDLARMYEFLPNDKTSNINADGNDVLNLTVPIVSETTTEEEAKNNPRVSRQVMAEFILHDLDVAEANIEKTSRLDKTMPDLAVVYGLKARYYMWLEDYANARDYARKAIDKSGAKPLSEDELTSVTNGFNTLSVSSWLWGMQTTKEDRVVTSGILNWTSWVCNETEFGYASEGPKPMVSKEMFTRISDTDCRKKWWVGTKGSAHNKKLEFVNDNFNIENASAERAVCEYGSIKFRPGSGDPNLYSVACVVGIPLMRVEEMYFIEAEAAEHVSPGTGKALCETFMKTYRDPNYTFPTKGGNVDGMTAAVEEIVFQKRVELWGEGQTFYDFKRLNISVDRASAGNFYANCRFTTSGRPAWMNFCIVRSEGNSNKAVMGWNNPDPSGLYKK